MAEPEYSWRASLTNVELHRLHEAAFRARSDPERDWVAMVGEHSLGWVTARWQGALVGFVNVITDGLVHSWLQDVMVPPDHQRTRIRTAVVQLAADHAKAAGANGSTSTSTTTSPPSGTRLADSDPQTAGCCTCRESSSGLRLLAIWVTPLVGGCRSCEEWRPWTARPCRYVSRILSRAR